MPSGCHPKIVPHATRGGLLEDQVRIPGMNVFENPVPSLVVAPVHVLLDAVMLAHTQLARERRIVVVPVQVQLVVLDHPG